jgi:hypothetical protein
MATQDWSGVVDCYTLRPDVVAPKSLTEGDWSKEDVMQLCAVRQLMRLFVCLESRNLVGKINVSEGGGFWSHVGENPSTIDGKYNPLRIGTLRNLVMAVAKDGGLECGKNETPGCAEKEKLAAHFLRGHAGSVAHSLVSLEGATWSSSLSTLGQGKTFSTYV